MLRKIRIALAAVFFIGITLLFIGIGQEWWGWMAKLQFLPACLALNIAVIAGLTLITLVVGRLYCSTICPLGVFQDIVLRIREFIGKAVNRYQAKHHKKISPKAVKRFSYSPERKILRYIFLGALVGAIFADIQMFVALIAPYSAYGRMVSELLHPSWGAVTIVAAATFVVIAFLAATHGRIWCETVCPVGTVLSLFSRYAMFRPVIDEDKCTRCHRCDKHCKASCIDTNFQIGIDYSRCIDCFDCISECQEDAVHYQFAWGKKKATGKKTPSAAEKSEKVSVGIEEKAKTEENGGIDRRAFLTTTAIFATAATAKALDGGLAPVIEKQAPDRKERLVPPGAGSIQSFYDHCTACQLCVSACPNDVLRPSTDLEHLMQPEMGYEKGFCRPECTACSDICPTGAITSLLEGQKQLIKIGTAHVNPDLCVVNRDSVECGNCARHCPVGAIRMIEKQDGSGLKVPRVMHGRCIGCGACEFLCPSRPISAITVNGLAEHKIKKH